MIDPPALLLPVETRWARRDPAVVTHAGVTYCFHTAVDLAQDPPALRIDVTTSPDRRAWSAPRTVLDGPENFSSPGNVLRVGGEWVMFLQSYPIDEGEQYGSAQCRLWSARSTDLHSWSPPEALVIAGSGRDLRRIDPFVVREGSGFRCLHKAGDRIVELVSADLAEWRESERPTVLAPEATPEGVMIENPSVVEVGEDIVLVYSPCRPGRGIGLARGPHLGQWREVISLVLPAAAWAPDGFTAGVLVPDAAGWVLFAHGETATAHGGALAMFRLDALDGSGRIFDTVQGPGTTASAG